MKVLFTGSRTWTKRGPIELVLAGLRYKYGKELTVICGYDPIEKTPKGVDEIVYTISKEMGITVVTKPAQWNVHGMCYCFEGLKTCRNAGPRRNQEMVDLKPDLVYAFRSQGNSPGTDDCIRRALVAKIPVYKVMPEAPYPDPNATGYRYHSDHDPNSPVHQKDYETVYDSHGQFSWRREK